MPAFVIQTFVPVRTYESPSRTARIVIEATSLPASASDRQYDPCDSPLATRGRYVRLSSSVPKLVIGSVDSFEISSMRLVDAHTRASSSAAIAWVTRSAPAPPCSTGRPSAGSSIVTRAWNASQSYRARWSVSAARGAILSSLNWRMTSRNWRCSSVSVIGCMVQVSRHAKWRWDRTIRWSIARSSPRCAGCSW